MKDTKDVVRKEDREDYNPYKEDKEFRRRTRKDIVLFSIAILILLIAIYVKTKNSVWWWQN